MRPFNYLGGCCAKGCCRTNANRSLFAQTRPLLSCAELTPLREGGSAVDLEICRVWRCRSELNWLWNKA